MHYIQRLRRGIGFGLSVLPIKLSGWTEPLSMSMFPVLWNFYEVPDGFFWFLEPSRKVPEPIFSLFLFRFYIFLDFLCVVVLFVFLFYQLIVAFFAFQFLSVVNTKFFSFLSFLFSNKFVSIAVPFFCNSSPMDLQ